MWTKALRGAGSGAVVCGLIALVGCGSALADESGLPNYATEPEILVDTPGTSASLAAGLYNSAAWGVRPNGGLYVGWQDRKSVGNEPKDWLGIFSLRVLTFSMQRFQLMRTSGEWGHKDEFTLGLAGGGRSGGAGLSYSWNKGGQDLMTRHKRLNLGAVARQQVLSVGIAGVFDMERKDNLLEFDLGIRPAGPRLTIFGDTFYQHGQQYKDMQFGYGLEIRPITEVRLAAKLRNTGDYSVRLDLDISGKLWGGARMHMDNDSHHRATTWAFETGGIGTPLTRHLKRKGQKYPELSLKGPMTYRRYKWFDKRRTLAGTLNWINVKAEDPEVGGLVLNLSGMRIPAEMVWELREQLAAFRATGKKVIIYGDRLGMSSYALASVADQVWIDPMGGVSLQGIVAGRTYFRNLLDKVGVGLDELRFFTYKSALESFTRTSLSEADREQFQAFIDDVYEGLAETVTTARGITRAEWDRIVNETGDLLPQQAMEAGLVDSIGTFEKAKGAARKAARRTTGDVSQAALAGVTGDRIWDQQEWGEPQEIAVIYAIGVCAMDAGIKGRSLAKTIRRARQNRQVKAVVLRADSPGGSALASDLVSRELLETAKKKPVIVSQGAVAGSGGYWISMYGDSIVAAPITVTGSIGVIGGHFWNDGFGDKVGLTYDFVSRGDHADLGRGMSVPLIGQLPERPMTAEERSAAEREIRALYDVFVEKVAEGREMTKEDVDKVAQGRIWSGTRGKEIGLVDEIGGMWEAMRMAKEAAGLKPDARVRYTHVPNVGTIFPGIFQRSTPLGSLASLFGGAGDAGAAAPPEEGPWALGDAESRVSRILGEAYYKMLSPEERLYLEQLVGSQGAPVLLSDPFLIRMER